MNLNDILLEHDLWLTRRFLEKAKSLTDAQLDEPLIGIGNPLSVLGEEKTLREMLHRLVFTRERWMDSTLGRQENENQTNPSPACSSVWTLPSANLLR